MEYNTDILKEKLDGYFNGKLSKVELGIWSERAYYDLLKGGYVEQEKIVIYPFIKMISQFYIEIDEIADKYPCSEEQIREIHEILNGKENFDFYVQVGIPELVYTTCLNKKSFNLKKRNLYCELKEALTKFIVKNEKNDLDKIIGLILSEKNSNQTLQDILEKNILDICRSFFNVGNSELLPPKALKLYTNKHEQISILKHLENYIDCYIGNKNFVTIQSQHYSKMKSGWPEIAFLIAS